MATKTTITDSSEAQLEVKSNTNQIETAQTVFNVAKSLLECPVCFHPMISPIYQCQNGHSICNVCIQKIRHCGECRVAFSGTKIRSLPLEKICSSVEVSCHNGNKGCNVTTTAAQLKFHLEVCPFRTTNFCQAFLSLKTCNHLVNDSTVLQHLVDQHQVKKYKAPYFLIAINTAVVAANKIESDSLVCVETSMDCPVLFRVRDKQGIITLTCLVLKHAENLQNYRVKYFIESPNKDNSFEFSGRIQPYRPFNEARNLSSLRLNLDFLTSNGFIEQDTKLLHVKVALYTANQTIPPWDSEVYQ